MMLIFEYQPKSKMLKMLSEEISIFKIFLGGIPPVWHASHAVCFTDYCFTITTISPEMDTVCYTLCVATPYYVPKSLPTL